MEIRNREFVKPADRIAEMPLRLPGDPAGGSLEEARHVLQETNLVPGRKVAYSPVLAFLFDCKRDRHGFRDDRWERLGEKARGDLFEIRPRVGSLVQNQR